MLVLDAVSKRFGSTRAVDGVSLEVEHGQVLGLLGPNGAGKSTTMRLMVGYLEPDEGSVSLDGISVTDNPVAVRQQIGYLPENNPLYPDLLVSELLTSSARLKHLTESEIAASLASVVPAVGLAHVYNRPIRELSKGYRQRVGIALALIHQPKLLILDEPTEGLDPNQRTEIRSLLRDLAQDRTVIISTHVLQEVSALCDRIVIINHGKIVADGTEKSLSRSQAVVFQAELEGTDLPKLLKSQKAITVLSAKKVGKRMQFSLQASGKVSIPPILAELQHKHHFIIWSLQSAGTNLEAVFRAATEDTTA